MSFHHKILHVCEKKSMFVAKKFQIFLNLLSIFLDFTIAKGVCELELIRALRDEARIFCSNPRM